MPHISPAMACRATSASSGVAAGGITPAKNRFASARRAHTTASKPSLRSAGGGGAAAGGDAVRVSRSRIWRCPPAGTSST
ncbi:hypothetical protein PSN01_05152 [Micromonospora saelicesensis]|nr:hypothetical protein PSN01_05152 [Micromonospora saelicesensis]